MCNLKIKMYNQTMSWCFAIVNGKLAEIFFERKKGKLKFLGHCYVKKSEHKTIQELKWIKKDSEKFNFNYRNGKYKDKITGKLYALNN